MPKDTSNMQMPAGEPDKIPGYVKKEIRASTPKHRGDLARGRAYLLPKRLITRAEKKLVQLLKDVPDEYLDRALRRLGEQLNATKKIWDMNAKCLIDIPDEKIRQDAALAILAYKWGKPVERAQVLHADAKDFPELLERLDNIESFKAIESQQDTPEGKQSTPVLPNAH
jgi:hypothetical protein